MTLNGSLESNLEALGTGLSLLPMGRDASGDMEKK